jgi:hypothetical protein
MFVDVDEYRRQRSAIEAQWRETLRQAQELCRGRWDLCLAFCIFRPFLNVYRPEELTIYFGEWIEQAR